MTGDAIGSLIRQVLTTLLSGSAAAAYMSSADATAAAAAIGTLVSVGWSIAAHWNKVKVQVK